MTEPVEGAAQELRPEAVWQMLLDEHAPPHDEERGWLSPAFWPLLQAAYAEPVLRSAYPRTPVDTLVPGHGPHIWGIPAEERRPTVAVWSDGWYSVFSRAAPDSERLLQTRDPVEAAALLARLYVESLEEPGPESGVEP
ncbi:DUF6193 family natural product biosynthesis protein [Micromonospora sp. NPDC005305]|uniref:DUF6193 family natural product biosynthesis protein n=1 Tax=Micromonospora sp. NPDC005305 TaxID=3156875 RepID=UPI00339F8F91